MSGVEGAVDIDIPGPRRALWRAMVIAYRTEPRLLIVSFSLVVGAWIPESLGALWLKVLVDGAVADDGGRITIGAGGLAAAAGLGWMLTTLGGRVMMRFRDSATIELEAHVAELQATVASIEHHERPEHLDRLEMLREQVFLLNHLYEAVMDFVGSVGRILITSVLLATVHPALILLTVFAIPNVVISAKRANVDRAAAEAAAPHQRQARHLFEIGTEAGPGKELRVGAVGDTIIERRAAAWQAWFDRTTAARVRSALWQVAGWTVFATGYAAAVTFVAVGLDAPAGDVLLTLAAGAGLSQFVGVTMGQTAFLRWTIDAAQRLVWLEDYVAAGTGFADQDAPKRLASGIDLDHVSFSYPGTDHLVLDGVDLHIPAGSVVAIVGENGAGKTTLVKLLLGMYRASEGAVRVDGIDLDRIHPEQWRLRTAGAFQDFFAFEYLAQRTIGVGDLTRLDDRDATEIAADRGAAREVIERLPAGLDTQLGPTWRNGVELSIGQWQRLALARGLMRDEPLLVVLDEPTASLDAETEHELFERFAGASRSGVTDGRVTVLVSHRFSTVRMADLIVVLDGARIAEVGSHQSLMAADGIYRDLYVLQASSYR